MRGKERCDSHESAVRGLAMWARLRCAELSQTKQATARPSRLRKAAEQPAHSPARAAQMSSTVSNGLGFASYETGLSAYRRLNEGASPGPAERGVIAGGAAVTVMAAIQPLEVCCRRMQVRCVLVDLTDVCLPAPPSCGLILHPGSLLPSHAGRLGPDLRSVVAWPGTGCITKGNSAVQSLAADL